MLWSLLAIFLGALAAYSYADVLINWCIVDVAHLVFIKPYEAFLLKLKVAVIAGLMLALPIIFFHVWRFVIDALSTREKHTVLLYLPISLGLFVTGAFFAFKIIVPFSMQFFLGQALPQLTPMISVNAYFSFLIWMVLVFGMVFELPLVVLFLAQAGIVTPDMMSRQRKAIVVGLFIAAALLTPPDVVSQIMLVIPLWVLLEISILLARLVVKE